MLTRTATISETQTAATLLPGPSWVWLVAGCVASVFACGGQWDIGVAAWLLPIFLLRFTRASALPLAVLGALVAMLAQNFAYIGPTAVPLNTMTVVLGLVVSIVFALPLILDRMLVHRLSPRSPHSCNNRGSTVDGHIGGKL